MSGDDVPVCLPCGAGMAAVRTGAHCLREDHGDAAWHLCLCVCLCPCPGGINACPRAPRRALLGGWCAGAPARLRVRWVPVSVSCGCMCTGMPCACFRENTFLSDNLLFRFTQGEIRAAKVTGHCGPEVFS